MPLVYLNKLESMVPCSGVRTGYGTTSSLVQRRGSSSQARCGVVGSVSGLDIFRWLCLRPRHLPLAPLPCSSGVAVIGLATKPARSRGGPCGAARPSCRAR